MVFADPPHAKTDGTVFIHPLLTRTCQLWDGKHGPGCGGKGAFRAKAAQAKSLH